MTLSFDLDKIHYMTFDELGLSEPLLKAAAQLGFVEPTEVQEQTIPFLLQNKQDTLALAQTGTGKTAAFGFPLLQHLSSEPQQRARTRALICAPTRELCMQIAKDLKAYAQFLPAIKIVAVYGGEDIRRQLFQLDETPDIIVATPGRLIDLVKRGKVDLQEVQQVVLDEADEMLDMGFQDDIEFILEQTPAQRQTMLFSATMPEDIARIAHHYMHDVHEIQIGQRNAGTQNVEHIYYVCRAQERYLVLKRIVDLNPDIYAIVFCRTKAETQEIAEKLIKDGYNADALHGDLTQVARDNVMQRFRLQACQILVATDVAARGLDVHNLTHVINYQLPDDPEIYTHRSGRTGRANQKGISISIVHQRETRRIQNLERMLKRTFTRQTIPSGIEVCKRQLFYQVNKIANADLSLIEEDTELMQDSLAQATKVLDYLTKEDLIKRFVALEFNRFLTYYKDAKDLNVTTAQERRGESEDRGAQRRNKGGRMVCLKVNIGARDGMNPKRFLALVNEATHDRSLIIGDIDIAEKYTFFSVYPDQMEAVIRAFSMYDGVSCAPAKGRRQDQPARTRFEDATNKGRKGNRNGRQRQESRAFDDANRREDKPWRRRR